MDELSNEDMSFEGGDLPVEKESAPFQVMQVVVGKSYLAYLVGIDVHWVYSLLVIIKLYEVVIFPFTWIGPN